MTDAVNRVEEFLDDFDHVMGGVVKQFHCPDSIEALYVKDIRAIIEENKRLRKDADRLNYLEAECNDLVCVSDAISDTGDADTVWEVAGHFMQKPYRRILAVSKDIRRAIDKAAELSE